jgi:chromosomal replication initiation ATPase DnaA
MRRALEPAPPGIRLATYLELEKMVLAFARGHFQLLILIGGHGLGKTRILRQALGNSACWLAGNLSVFGLYCQLWISHS